MRSYTQLTLAQRYQIHALLKTGHRYPAMAEVLGVHKSTMSREVRRNRGLRGYHPQQAQQFTVARRQSKARPRILPETWELIERLLREQWSPEQISGWLRPRQARPISHEWIYQYVLQDKQPHGSLYRHLRCQKQRRKRYGSYQWRGQLRNRVSIDQRPAVVDRRARLGDWELDTIIGTGHQQALVSLTERKPRLSLLAKIERKQADVVATAGIHLLKPLALPLHTVTSDNGKAFAHHEVIAQTLNVQFFFAHPYASGERGLNENTNGLIRQYFPKHRRFATITEDELHMVQTRLNNRPRKSLAFKTPNQVCFGINPSVALGS